MSGARHIPLAIACIALAMALNERGQRTSREYAARRVCEIVGVEGDADGFVRERGR